MSVCVICLTFSSDITRYIFDNLVYNGFTFRMPQPKPIYLSDSQKIAQF